MPYCFSCGNEIREGHRFCNICGTPLDKPVFCIKCGLPMSKSAAFCRRCGTSNHAKHAAAEPLHEQPEYVPADNRPVFRHSIPMTPAEEPTIIMPEEKPTAEVEPLIIMPDIEPVVEGIEPQIEEPQAESEIDEAEIRSVITEIETDALLPEEAEPSEEEKPDVFNEPELPTEVTAREEEPDKRKRLVRVCVLGAVAAILLLVASVYLTMNGLYDQARDLAQQERYVEAIEKFRALGDFKDARDQVRSLRIKQAEKLLNEGYYDNAAAIYEELELPEKVKQVRYAQACELATIGELEQAALLFESLGDHQDSKQRAEKLRSELAAQEEDARISAALDEAIGYMNAGRKNLDEAQQLRDNGGAQDRINANCEAAITSLQAAYEGFAGLGDYGNAPDMTRECAYYMGVAAHETGDKEKAKEYYLLAGEYPAAVEALKKLELAGAQVFSAWNNLIAWVRTDGTVETDGNKSWYCDAVDDWTDIVSVAAGPEVTYGLKGDGIVVKTALPDSPKVMPGWTDVVAISVNVSRVVGLRADGTVLASGYNEDGQNNVSDWTDIIAIDTGRNHTVGLRKDGTVVAVGSNQYGQCNVSSWTDIVAIAAGRFNTVGVRSDGTVVAVGDNSFGQCKVSGWSGVVAVSVGEYHTVGLRSDGTVIATGANGAGQINVSAWKDVVCIDTGDHVTLAVTSDGTLLIAGYHTAKVKKLENIKLP